MRGRWAFLGIAAVVFLAPEGCMRGDRILAVRRDGSTGTTPFGDPSLVAGLRAPTDDIQDPTLTADQLEIYFASPNGGRNDIWRSQRAAVTEPWGASALVAELSSAEADEDPDLSPDGLTVFLASDRLGEAGVMRVWLSHRAARDQPWDPPVPVLGLGSSSADVAPSVEAAGLSMIFASLRGTPDFHLYAATRTAAASAWEQVEELVEVNSSRQDRDPALFNQGRELIFASRRTDEGRTSDLFHVARSDARARFGDAAPIDELNTDTWEGDPWVSADGRAIFFVSDRNGISRIYEAHR